MTGGATLGTALAGRVGRSASAFTLPEELLDLIQLFPVLIGELAARTQNLFDETECATPRFDVLRQHGRNSGESSVLIDQQDVELLADKRLELRKRHVAMRLAQPSRHLETALVDGIASEADVNERADDGGAQPAGRNARFELGNPRLEQLAMQRVVRRLARRARGSRVDAER